MKKEVIMKWVMFVSFGLVLLGGLNMLFMGLFNINPIGAIFGGSDSVGARVIWSFVGLGAVALLSVVLIKAFSQPQQRTQTKTA